MKTHLPRILLLLFFVSGFTGLVYQVVWTRQLLLVFGSTTHSVVVVISAFMGGLALGSLLVGILADRIKNSLKLYGVLECIVGSSALSTIFLFEVVKVIYQQLSVILPNNDQIILLVKFLLTTVVLLPPTIAMGGTLPVLIKFFTTFSTQISYETSKLYAINTIGATVGVLLTGFVFIELFGLRISLLLAVVLNFIIALVSLLLSPAVRKEKINSQSVSKVSVTAINKNHKLLVLGIFTISGFISLSYEVLWTRLLTPSVGTYIYAFSAILGLFLLGIALGSFLYKKYLTKFNNILLVFGLVEVGIGLSAFFSVLANTDFVNFNTLLKVGLTVLPGTVLMGISFPVVTKIFNTQTNIGKDIGTAYSVNTVGSILGSLVTAFLIIPYFGTIQGILVLSLGNFILGGILIFQEKYFKNKNLLLGSLGIILLLVIYSLTLSLEFLQEGKLKQKLISLKSQGDYEILFLEDEVASVLGYNKKSGGDNALIIDGVQTTSLGAETALLAHLPIFLHPNPKDMLVIAFGMGTTFRSALLHENMYVDAVELVPSVPKMMHLFHPDAKEVLANPRGKIIINDGRNYVLMNQKKYDIIVVDPPPPINAAGTTVLYSKEFYQDSKKRLNPGGIFVAWFYTGARVDDFRMLFKSFYDEFPHILLVSSPGGWGYYMIGSQEQIIWDSLALEKKYTEEKFFNDINQTRIGPNKISPFAPFTFKNINDGFLGNESLIAKFTAQTSSVTDDHPLTEYFLIRQKRSSWPMIGQEWFIIK